MDDEAGLEAVWLKRFSENTDRDSAHTAAFFKWLETEGATRCAVTDNPVGTDTRPIGWPCRCAPCLQFEEDFQKQPK